MKSHVRHPQHSGIPECVRRRALLLALLLCLAGLSGACSSRHSGDFGEFITREVARLGGRANSDTELPRVRAEWTLKRDEAGFEAFVVGAAFEELDEVLQRAFGPPRMSGLTTGTVKGRPYRTWGAADIGVAMNVIGLEDQTEIVCVKGDTVSVGELLDRMMDELESVDKETDSP